MQIPSFKPRSADSSLFDTVIRLIVLLVLIVWCGAIILPFVAPVLWGGIIAIVLYPLFVDISRRAGNREALAGVIMTSLLLLLVILPCLWVMRSLFEGILTFATHLKNHTLAIPPPDERILGWPVIGKRLHAAWLLASQNLESAVTTYREPLGRLGILLLSSLAGFGKSFLLFLLSLIIAGVFLVKGRPSAGFARKFIVRVAGERGEEIFGIAGQTIKQVAKGILGVAFIQFILAGAVLMLAGVPFAGVWALCVLMLAIIQVPTGVVIIPVIVYLLLERDVLPATVWAVLLVLVSLSDNFLKPVLMGKGAPVPTLVIFIGAVGGMIFSGFIGLFTGAIILSVGYALLVQWIGPTHDATDTKPAGDLPD
jgi:predicted PurR-regulated permease PerM